MFYVVNFSHFNDVKSIIYSQFWPGAFSQNCWKKPWHLKELSAQFVYCIYLLTLLAIVSNDANGVDPAQTALDLVPLGTKGFQDVLADDLRC